MQGTLTLLDEILNAVEYDARIDTGIFDIGNPSHIDVFIDHVTSRGLKMEFAINCANILTEGKYPERQAFNVNGLLVTFPTPEYKQRALSNGTHFEHNPKDAQVNIFGADAAQQPQVPVAGSQQAAPQANNPAVPPANNPQANTPPPTNAPEPQAQPTSSIQAPRSPAEVAQDAQIVKSMMTELTLNEAIKSNVFENGSIWFNGIRINEMYVHRNSGAEIIKIKLS
jgi:hypothetical protein